MAVHIGDLAARAEAILSRSAEEAQLVLTWIAAIAGTENARLLKLTLPDAALDGTAIGNWTVSIRMTRGQGRRIELARQDWLAEEGHQVAAIAQKTLASMTPGPKTGPETDPKAPGGQDRERLMCFAVLLLIRECGPKSQRIRISDSDGRRFTITLRRNRLRDILTTIRRAITRDGQGDGS